MPNCDITVALGKGCVAFSESTLYNASTALGWESIFKKSKMEFNHDMLLTKNA